MTNEAALSCRVDYYRATTNKPELIKAQREGHFSDDKVDETGSLYHYAQSVTNRSSKAVYLFGGFTENMGNCVQLSGQPIAELMATTDKSSIPAIRTLGIDEWKPTRVDIAIDCFHPLLRPRHFFSALDRKDKRTTFRSEPREVKMKNPDKGHTVYMGGSESEKQLRVYDKCAERGAEGIWTRYEMVFMGQRAVDVWGTIQDCQSDNDLLGRALAIFATFVDFPKWKLWRDVFGTEKAHEWTTIPRSTPATWEWLITQVAPAFRRAYDNDKGWKMLDEFVEAVKQTVRE